MTDLNAKAPLAEIHRALPAYFNSVSQWPGSIHPIRDQGSCASCWAHKAFEVLPDRFCIASGGTINVDLSPQEMVSCDNFDKSYHGGFLTTS